MGALKTLKINPNTIKALENAKNSVDYEQQKISSQLYSQGFILLTGAAEALLKDIFICLLKENFTQISTSAGVNFSAKELQEILATKRNKKQTLEELSSALGDLTVKKLYSSKNPVEKINFQNVNTTKEILNRHFGIKLADSVYLNAIHKYWQMRHALIHNNGIIDERYVSNTKKVKLHEKSEQVGSTIEVTKSSFDDATQNFLKLFKELDKLVNESGLKCSLISVSQNNTDSP